MLLSFPRNGTHRDLHSFPTRRSSDLCCGSARPAIRDASPSSAPPGAPPPPAATPTPPRATCSARSRSHLRPPSAPTDRKSTRLNSSHVEISYAVFCLKKKNNNDKDIE